MKLSQELEQWRLKRFQDKLLLPSGPDGIFKVRRGQVSLHIVSSSGDRTGWEHVSVSAWIKRRKQVVHRCPTWEEMCFVKDLFWDKEETVVQFHPPESEYINNHDSVLHLWKWVGGEFPMPPASLVGIKGITQDEARKLAKDGIFFELNK